MAMPLIPMSPLAPDVYAVGVNGDLVFLDVGRDGYACLPQGEQSARLSPDRRQLAISDPDLAAELALAGLVVGSADAPQAETNLGVETLLPPPTRSALLDHYVRPQARDAAEATVALTDLVFAYRGRRFSQILGAVRRPRVETPRLSAELIATVEVFHRWAPFAPTSAKCLLRAFMLLRLLRRRRLDALWVFGVRTWPFHAHCWLQCEDTVLDDQPDRIRAFTPIMIV
jgi:hypothetical protein